ncbi:hypothetical protein [Dielma fastidiosa]|uniref:Uncharacterized protein n=1 Tax=Dielma fastidiosa TaxID=1034346 RepID=A0A318KI69_9FIRM|nr:hypothetical protein [Dielma fastidiosa]PXX73401.1 hypothetical protein DES51_1394 [Dielma fastidiosa]
MKCEKCGKELEYIEVNSFNYDGSDSFDKAWFEEKEVDAVVLEIDKNWTGYELDEEEMTSTIRCPHCNQFPFKNKEIQVYEVVRAVMFKEVIGDE